MIRQFFSHLFPKKFSGDTLSPSKTLYMGMAVTSLFLCLIATGMLLLFYYSPDNKAAYGSVIFLEEKVSGGAVIRSLHRMCSHILLVLAAVHLLRTVMTGVYSARAVNWKLGYIVFALIIFEAYTGYLLPMDQLSYWATKTGMELMNTLPLGTAIKSVLLPDDVGGRLTLLRFFALHVVLIPLLCTALIAAHLYNVRRDGGLLPYRQSEKMDSSVLIRFSIIAGFITIVVAFVLSVVFKAPLGTAANPAAPPNPAKSAWFLLWIQEIVSWRAWLFNAVAVLFFACYFLPDFGRGRMSEISKWFRREDAAVWGGVLAVAVMIVALTVVAMFFRGKNWELVSFWF